MNTYLTIFFNIFSNLLYNIEYWYNNNIKIHYTRYISGLEIERIENNASHVITQSIRNYNNNTKNIAAINIQKIYRGHLERKELAKKKIAAKMINEWLKKKYENDRIKPINNSYSILSYFTS